MNAITTDASTVHCYKARKAEMEQGRKGRVGMHEKLELVRFRH